NQQAWDVAAYINSHERPQDPRFKGDIGKLKQEYHMHQGYYGQSVDGQAVLGSKSFINNPKKGE
ncbi:c-type cytochrome, partial [Shewanella sp. 0m-11]